MPDGAHRAGCVRCRVLDTGYCLASEHHLIQGGRRATIACHSIVALLHHPVQGWLLWDTGYAPHMLTATRRLPYALYRRVTPLRLSPELAVAAQLPRWGLTTADIGHIILSHFHADHVAGLRDFPAAALIAHGAAYAEVAGRSGFAALRRGFIPALVPDDFERRATLLPQFTGGPLPGLGPTHDLFDDGTLLLVELPGHARGQMGLLVEAEDGPVLFAADACWLTRSVHERRPPHRITHLFVDDPQAVAATIDALHAFAIARPDVRIIPSHCPDAFAREVGA